MNFDMFDAQHAVQQCKIVGFGILKFPRAGYFNLLTWLQPMTRWEREVTVKNGCMGKPAEWNKKKWNAMSYGSLCSTVFSSKLTLCPMGLCVPRCFLVKPEFAGMTAGLR
uniref:Uncharacterized protein n=1 Tax=Cacopsylla melanoneura TaxID=428564 RepID=A0A8D8QQ86_9HEMI